MKVLLPIQALRALAATAVVVGHFQLFTATPASGYWLPYDKLAAAGVDLFFVISGFVMVYASEPLFGRADGPPRFLARRVIRVVPLYWLATTLYVALAAAIPSLDVYYSPKFLAASYLFIPAARPDGTMNPIVGQGWTLNYEMLFYLVFACTLLATRLRAVVTASFLLIAMVAAGPRLGSESQVLAFWTDPIILEFVFGMMLGLVYPHARSLPRWTNVALAAAAMALFVAGWAAPDLPRVIASGIPATLLLAGATLGGFAPTGIGWRALGVVGDASYALYLFHAFPIHAMLRLFQALGIDVETWRPLCLGGTIAVAILMSVAIYYAFERPVTRTLRSMLGRHATLPSGRAASPAQQKHSWPIPHRSAADQGVPNAREGA